MSRIKIQNVGLGNYIRNPKGVRQTDAPGMNIIEALKITQNNGNSFLCYPVKDPKASPVTLDTTRFYDIPIDTMVERASI